MIILGIESSCDETAVSVLKANKNRFEILSHVIASQIKTHHKYGGVIPEVAARQHVTNMIPVLDIAMTKAKIKPKDISAITVAKGPGLITSLRVGVQTAKTLGLLWDKPIIAVNHMEGHIYANWFQNPDIKLPALCLTVSGGHTELVLINQHSEYKLIGRTRDDAAGEAFDKVAKLLKLGYPGGPKIQALAKKGNPNKFDFPRPMMAHNNFDFSFSGLKTSVLYLVKKSFRNKKIPINDICASFQQAVVDVLTNKTLIAANKLNVKSVLLAGGVAANIMLREELGKKIKRELSDVKYYYPPLNLCTDNAAMIAMAGYFRILKKDFADWKKLDADPNWELV
ncbi:MAG: tRNA (adenosine(37)-N6)-threonylcarbamoyltransferase complex transferase subunit TsaD [bacterium]|nr:tRNA (adenosine(37)-N6)-threonylcarbamoyltransferase complex transferase subunit TsaD [bacterium]